MSLFTKTGSMSGPSGSLGRPGARGKWEWGMFVVFFFCGGGGWGVDKWVGGCWVDERGGWGGGDGGGGGRKEGRKEEEINRSGGIYDARAPRR